MFLSIICQSLICIKQLSTVHPTHPTALQLPRRSRRRSAAVRFGRLPAHRKISTHTRTVATPVWCASIHNSSSCVSRVHRTPLLCVLSAVASVSVALLCSHRTTHSTTLVRPARETREFSLEDASDWNIVRVSCANFALVVSSESTRTSRKTRRVCAL